MPPETVALHNWQTAHRALDRAVRYMLMLGMANKRHLLSIANHCGSVASKGLAAPLHLRVGTDALLATLEEDLLDPVVVKGVLSLDRHNPLLLPRARKVLELLDVWCEGVADLARQMTDILLAHGLAEKIDCQNPPPLHELFLQLIDHQALDAARDVLDRLDSSGALPRSGDLRPVALKLQGDLHFFTGKFDEARACYDAVSEIIPDIVMERRAQTLLKLGERQSALDALAGIVRQRPWRTNTVLRLHDLLREHDRTLGHISKTSILLYTYNHAPDLEQTLESLAASSAAACDVFVLNNGCTDDTAQVMAKWQGSGAFSSFKAVTLPVNVGAPAARNWLLSMAPVMANPCICYLDDDATLPKDWLGRLYHAQQTYPEAGVCGAKVREFGSPHILQQVDLNLTMPRENDSLLGFSDLQLMTTDVGQFDYMRPATSVTGCCHLFRRDVFKRVGDFDIRFSPTQFDDLDHSLRMVQAGIRSVYTGHLAVDHRQISGGAARKNRLAYHNALGNYQKLQGKYPVPIWQQIVASMGAVLHEDYLRKLVRLALELAV